MGSSCSSGQSHKDKDSGSTHSEDSPGYHVQQPGCKKPSQGSIGNPNHSAHHSGVILDVQNVGRQNNGTTASESGMASPSHVQIERKPLPGKTKRDVANSTASCDSMSLSSPPGTSAQSPRDWQQFPTEVRQLGENAHNLLTGKVAAAKTNARNNKIVIYVCAADSQDCCCEKRALHTVVYPELRTACQRRGYELHIVDLHWKTGLEKQQDHEFPELCLGELARQSSLSYVIPVLFLSNSLGTPLLPNTVEKQDFEIAVKSADDKQLLQKWYSLDSHAQAPCYRLQPITKLPGFKENTQEQKEQALKEWRTEIERTLAVLVEVFPQELRDTYLTTVVEQEIHNTVCMSQEMARRCLWVYRVYTQAGQSESSTPGNGQSVAGEAELKRRLDNLHKDLKTQLSEKHILRVPVPWNGGVINPTLPDHAQYLATVTKQLTTQLSAIIDGIVEDHDKVVLKPSYGIDNRLLEELTQQTSYCQRAAQCSINRETVLNQIKTYLMDEHRGVLLAHGPQGSGRSTLLARVAQCCASWLPDAAVMVRFVGVSTDSMTVEQLLASLVNQCSVLSTGQQVWDSHNVETYSRLLPRLLLAASLQRPQIIIIDGIDQVRDYGTTQSLDWLPRELPPNVKMIVSIADDSDMYRSSSDMAQGRILIQMPLLDKKEADSMLMASVMQYNHSVSREVQDCVRASVQDCTLPLYVKILAWQTSWWSDMDLNMKPLGNVEQQAVQMLEELEAILDREKVERALALMTVTKTGVTDSEMLDLLAHDPAFHSKDTYVLWAPACLFWARLNKHLAPFVQWAVMGGASTLRWRDAIMERVVRQRYLGQREQAQAASQQLVHYFSGHWVTEALPGMLGRLQSQLNKTETSYNRRKLDELPYQVYQLTGSMRDQHLLDHAWLYDKLCGSDVKQVLEDFNLEEATSPTKHKDLAMLRNFFEQQASALSYDGRQFYSQLHKYLSSAKPDSALAQELLALCSDPPVCSLIPLTPLVGEQGEAATQDSLNPATELTAHYDSIVSLGLDNFVATLSAEREEISVWSIKDCSKVRELLGVTQPIKLEPVDSYRSVVLCRRELRMINLDEGAFEVKLKGVMNQKMPYFGLHDPEHLVALSRNRMYVNLMNLTSGDCVTTFKAGEDRFLNSLLVSGDGRVLVCGDETQKPFPLLVWNLASRKLLYDLRIPHHDFVTALSAITYEGNFVCCVATEVDEPGPNFIVVYDLQSGTLFKKWKPGVDTVSLAISSKDGCVVSGLEDARILVWDLITGNCRCTLVGHTAPVNFLRLDPGGGAFLSSDSLCRDRSLRLWDLNKGYMLAVFTPSRPVSCSEVVSGGRFVVMALRGASIITTLQLRGPGIDSTDLAEVSSIYGRQENNAKKFNLDETDR